MFRYLPNTTEQQKQMLADIGLASTEDLFRDIPAEVRLQRPLNLPAPLSEMELADHMKEIAGKNASVDEYACFLGAGAYDHFIPSVVNHLISRQEFYTAYTPYQPEISQGTLQAIFEYQTMICELTGMDVSNASMYDGATALAEAVFMACQAKKRNEVLVARTVHPEYRTVLDTYTRFRGIKVLEIGYENGVLNLDDLESRISEQTAAVVVQNPNFLGAVEDLDRISEIASANKIMFITVTDPISLALLKSPGEAGADIAVGEGQPLGNALGFGGPHLGFMAVKKDLLRRMPGRIAGETTDTRGRRGFLLTVQAREQHIRREKATSNICSNQALNALAAVIYLTVMGREGLKQVANLCIQKARYACESLLKTGKFERIYTGPYFREFALKSKRPVAELNDVLLKNKIIGGYDLSRDYPELDGGWLLAVTEKRTRKQIDRLVEIAGGEE